MSEARVVHALPSNLGVVPAMLSARMRNLRDNATVPQEIVDQFDRYLQSADERALFRMSPYRYARGAGIPDRAAVDLFIHATHAGLLDFSWGVLCPLCGGFLSTPSGLKSLAQDKPCDLCNIEVRGQMDDNVEVAFTVSEAVRKIRYHEPDALDFKEEGLTLFFSQSIEMPPEVCAMIQSSMFRVEYVPAKGELTFEQTFEPGFYGVMAPAHHAVAHVVVAAGITNSRVELECFEGRLVPAFTEVGPGPVVFHIINRADGEVMVGLLQNVVGDPRLPHPADVPPFFTILPFLTGKQLVTTQSFQELFRTESLPSGGGLELKNLTVLFTDLKGSTELYERIGDFRAFELVREHFDVMREIIARNGGAVVKTIGDACMGSFSEPLAALEAASALKRDVRKVGVAGEHDLMLKIGLHSGPCIAVESNERLDYFGQTVNIAARAQGVASANEVVCTDPVFTAPGAEPLIKTAFSEVLKDRAFLKGVDNPFKIYRLR